jgi:FkbM family methyltransferase
MSHTSPLPSPEYSPFSEAPLTPGARRRLVLASIDVVLDVGANAGQYGHWLRSLGYHGRLISFEPGERAFRALQEAAKPDPLWDCHHFALGPRDGSLELRISHDSIGSSAFTPTARKMELTPEAVQDSTEHAAMRSLASLWRSLGCAGTRAYLKVDVEGFELEVLRGANSVLKDLSYMELELSFAPVYSGAPLFGEVFAFASAHGFDVFAIEQTHGDDSASGQMLMGDGIFINARLLESP